jgi:hypothetical protein
MGGKRDPPPPAEALVGGGSSEGFLGATLGATLSSSDSSSASGSPPKRNVKIMTWIREPTRAYKEQKRA